MSMKYLGEQFDIHTGGIDHIRIHHTNEIAQSEGATGKKWVNYWLHNEFLVMNKGKMSKSAGNFITLKKVTEAGFAPLDYRFLLLGGHYRSQLTFSWEAMETARNARKNLEQRIAQILCKTPQMDTKTGITADQAHQLLHSEQSYSYLQQFIHALEEDISTPRSLSVLQQAVKDKDLPPEEITTLINIFDTVLGLQLLEEAQRLHSETDQQTAFNSSEIERLIAERAEAKKRKDFRRADEIRQMFKEQGIILEDTINGTTWRKL